jgi:1-acyl-sn-glycerol-3-phosphate acyltransferase
MSFLRSLLFMVWFLTLTLVMGVLFLPLLLGPRRLAVGMARLWAGLTLAGLQSFARISRNVVGNAPRGAVLIASKHMSMWDTLALYLELDDPGIVLKRELLYVPFFGWYLWKTAAIAIDRGGKADAMRKMARAASAVLASGRPVLIFPEGTRKKPGAAPDYKSGVSGLYALLKVACVPAALDSGRYWQGFWKRPGTITLQFLEPIPPGLKRAQFMPILQERIETATQALLER